MNHLKQSLKFRNIPTRKALQKARRRLPILKYPKKIEDAYTLLLKSLVKEWESIYFKIMDPQLENLSAQSKAFLPSAKQDSWTTDLENLEKMMTLNLNKTLEPVPKVTAGVGEQVSNYNLKELMNAVDKAIGIPVYTNETWLNQYLQSFSAQNVQLITKLKEETSSEINRIVQSGLQQGKRVEEIRKELLSTDLKPGVFSKVRTRAELIARDQVGKLTGQLTKLRQNELGVQYYTWRTSLDERVRDSHQVLEGKLCDWNDPTVYSDDNGKSWKSRSSIDGFEGEPGQDFQCRCYAEPNIEKAIEEIEQTPLPEPEKSVMSTPEKRIEPELPSAPVPKTKKQINDEFKGSGRLETVTVTQDQIDKTVQKFKTVLSDSTDEFKRVVTERIEYYKKQFGARIGGEIILKNTLPSHNKYLAANFSRLVKRDIKLVSTDLYVGRVKNSGIKSVLENSVKTGYHPPGCDTLKSVVDHEMGHSLYTGLSPAQKMKVIQEYDKSKDIVEKVSKYAAKDSGEYFAECWAEYTNNPKCRPTSKKLIESVMNGFSLKEQK